MNAIFNNKHEQRAYRTCKKAAYKAWCRAERKAVSDKLRAAQAKTRNVDSVSGVIFIVGVVGFWGYIVISMGYLLSTVI